MDIHLNGEVRSLEKNSTIAALLQELNIRSDQVAVEVNLHIVDKQQFAHHQLQEGDRVEIMSFIGGGSGYTCPQQNH